MKIDLSTKKEVKSTSKVLDVKLKLPSLKRFSNRQKEDFYREVFLRLLPLV